jgi:DNA-binding response OmpR family regulator
LLIEDDSATAQSIELMLKSESFNVYTTNLGEEGVDLGKLYDYDIILLDLNLPDMSGYEVLRSLRVSKVRTPILILSGLAGMEDTPTSGHEVRGIQLLHLVVRQPRKSQTSGKTRVTVELKRAGGLIWRLLGYRKGQAEDHVDFNIP